MTLVPQVVVVVVAIAIVVAYACVRACMRACVCALNRSHLRRIKTRFIKLFTFVIIFLTCLCLFALVNRTNMFYCGQCVYKSKRKYDVGRHERAMHGDSRRNELVKNENIFGYNHVKRYESIYNEWETFDIQLEQNFKLFVSGPSRCGKTVFISKLILNIQLFPSSLLL